MRHFAVCISSWLPVLETGPAGREEAYEKVLMVSMKQRTEQAYCIFLPRDSMFVLRKQKNQIMSSM